MQTQSSRTGAAVLAIALVTGLTAVSARKFTRIDPPAAPAFRMKGPPAARVVIAEFSDLQCPACKMAVEPLNQILKMFPDDVRVVFKHYPLRMHTWAVGAAVASDCAGAQGKFWEYHEKLFATQRTWGEMHPTDVDKVQKLFREYAAEAGLDAAAFDACLKDPEAAKPVFADQKEAAERWIGSTPTFFINGKRFVGANQLRSRGLNHIENLLK